MIDGDTSIHDVVYTSFDFETTGFNPDVDQIVEIGAVRFTTEKLIEEFSTLIKPTITMSDAVIAVHGITNESLKDAPPIEQKILKFSRFIADTVLVAHNILFDFRFLNGALVSCGERTLQNIPLIDTVQVAKRSGLKCTNYKLQTIAEHLKIRTDGGHRALDDARTCRSVYLHCTERMSMLGQLELSRILV